MRKKQESCCMSSFIFIFPIWKIRQSTKQEHYTKSQGIDTFYESIYKREAWICPKSQEGEFNHLELNK